MSLESDTSTPPLSPAAAPASRSPPASPARYLIHIWDWPTRVFHWSLFLLVCAAVVSVKLGGEAMVWHGRIGRLILALLWYGPRAVLAYLRGRWRGVGHNPLGAWSVFALLLVLLLMAASGLVANDDAAYRGPLYRAVDNGISSAVTLWHKRGEWLIYGLVALHLLAVLFYSLVRRNRLIKPMFTGHKWVDDSSLVSARGGGPAMLLLAVAVAVAAWWFSGGTWLPEPPLPPPPAFDW